MNRTPAPEQASTESQYGPPSLANFLHVAHNNPGDLEAYLHRYVDDLARAELELPANGRSA